MKIQVALKIKTNSDVDTTIDLSVTPFETVESVKEKVATAQLIPFPDQELSINGKVLDNDAKLSACGILEGSSLSFDVKASETIFTQQLTELLKTRDLSADELGLLYCYKHGVSPNQALKLLAFEGKLEDFVIKQKSLSLNNGKVALVQDATPLKPFSVTDEVVQLLKASSSGTMDVKELSAKFVEKFGVSLASLVGSKPGDFLVKEKRFVIHGKGLVSLQGTKPPTAAPAEAKPEASIAAPPGLSGSAPVEEEYVCIDNKNNTQQYLDLHTKICGRAFNSKITQVLNDLVAAISEACFLDIDHVVAGGSAGKGTAIQGKASAEVVLFLRGMPQTGQETWAPPLLKALASIFSADFQAAHGLESVCAAEDSIRMVTRGSTPMAVDVYLSPAFDSYAQTLQVLKAQAPDGRKFYASSLAKERTQFVARQPSSVKVTMRLVKWWRDQQEWYGCLARPSDELLEYATIYSAVQTKPTDQRVAIANLMSLLSRFTQLRVVWSNFYSKDEVCKPLLRQRPLLMDPTNPCVNVADPQSFDPSELMALARTTRFFW